jgi:hypothetical protein
MLDCLTMQLRRAALSSLWAATARERHASGLTGLAILSAFFPAGHLLGLKA